MDSRQKIITLSRLPALVADGGWIGVAGLFDPLTLTQADRLAAIAKARRLLAVIAPNSDTLLPAEARAALIAALRPVDAVVIATAAEVRACGVDVLEDDTAERARSAEFVNFVLQR